MLDEDKIIIEKALNLEKAGLRDNPEHYLGWEWHEIDEPPHVIMRLFRKGLVTIPFKSNKHTCYMLKDREEAKVLLEEVEPQVEPTVNIHKPLIPEDIFDTVIGYDDLKFLIKTSLQADKPVHIIFLGGPATAKTIFLMELARIRGAQYHLGGSSTKVGLTDILLDYAPRILIIDELDKMDPRDFSVLLSLCQTGIVKETKHGRMREVELLNTQVFAAANRRDFPPEIESRFEIINMPEYTDEDAYNVMFGVLTKRENTPEDLAATIASRTIKELRTRDPREAIRIARLAKTPEEIDRVISIVQKYQGEKLP